MWGKSNTRKKAGPVTAALAIVAGAGFAFVPSAVASTGHHWYVFSGTHTVGSAVQGLGFYPNVITIDAGDTITWLQEETDPDTVSFLNGTRLPFPGSAAALSPAGGATCCTVGQFVSSGFLLPGGRFSLSFPKPGVFIDRALLHGGHQGVVIVNPSGSAYPMTQAQYNTQAYAQAHADLVAGLAAEASYQVSTSPGPSGTTIYHAAAGISPAESTTVALTASTGSKASGTVHLGLAGPGKLALVGSFSGLSSGLHAARIGLGTCAASAGTAFPLPSLPADSSGAAGGRIVVSVPPMFVLPEAGLFLEVASGPTLASAPAACGNVVYHNATVDRFLPTHLSIHQGDQIVWTNMALNNVHTVTFLAAGQQPSADPGIPPAGGSTYSGTGSFNSGVLVPFQSYGLTFATAGTYSYRCLFHDELGMIASVTVLP